MTNKMNQCILFIYLLFFTLPDAYAEGHASLTRGEWGKGGAVSGSIEGGYILPNDTRNYIVGGGISIIENRGEKYKETDDLVWSHEMEFYILGGIRLLTKNEAKKIRLQEIPGASKESGTYLITSIGLSNQSVDVPSGWVSVDRYGEHTLLASIDDRFYFNFSGQLRFVYKYFVFGAGYHNRRGVIIALGFNDFSP